MLDLRPKCLPSLRIEKYCHDMNVVLTARASGCFPSTAPKELTFVVTLPGDIAGGIRVLVMQHMTVSLLPYCDGSHTVRKIVEDFKQSNNGKYAREEIYNSIVELFELGVVSLLRSQC
jgi:hypothetical protein